MQWLLIYRYFHSQPLFPFGLVYKVTNSVHHGFAYEGNFVEEMMRIFVYVYCIVSKPAWRAKHWGHRNETDFWTPMSWQIRWWIDLNISSLSTGLIKSYVIACVIVQILILNLHACVNADTVTYYKKLTNYHVKIRNVRTTGVVHNSKIVILCVLL